MKKYIKIITSFFLIISSIIFAIFLWVKIYSPFTNPLEITGEYSKQSYNPINEPARYLILISLLLFITLL
jgi:YbbR domain-containing protein